MKTIHIIVQTYVTALFVVNLTANAFYMRNLRPSAPKVVLLDRKSHKNPGTNSDDLHVKEKSHAFAKALSIVSISAAMVPIQAAFAKDGEFGILEGKTNALIHPIVMISLFVTTLYSGYLGLQWRQLRELSDKIKSASQLESLPSGRKVSFPLSSAIEEIQAEISVLNTSAVDEANIARTVELKRDIAELTRNQLTERERKYNQLVATRKSLLAANVKDKHFASGSVLLGVGTLSALYGALDSYWGAGELFADSHLFAGATITALWAAAAALVPLMQKGNENARRAHIALNTANVGLFCWQLVTGFGILEDVWNSVPWP